MGPLPLWVRAATAAADGKQRPKALSLFTFFCKCRNPLQSFRLEKQVPTQGWLK